MNRTMTIAILAAMVAAQWAVPMSMIAKREMTLSQGTQYKFRCEPVDPYDAFRGKYVALRIQPEGNLTWKGTALEYNQEVYVALGTDDDGFVRVDEILLRPPNDRDYVTAKVSWNSAGAEAVSLQFPFDRFYLEENKAPEAERAYNQSLRREVQDTYISVRVRKGFGVIEELYISDTPLDTFLEEQAR